ncbi:uncharacterized protein B0T23DRAFT_144476 [Neurospora hispaniola]|uniref:DUF7730 domain-containing protein n=1 Tax=Neurospora hispaniola TaxID=588809 RepID=A0AAJ0I846_9PEZI|nr:hypothetical protein B0T23DRAFT_144476 [Neurospora hispaniola]
MLRQHIATRQPPWKTVWKQCNKEENMSVRTNWVHPNIKFVTPEEGEAADPSGPRPADDRRFNFNALPAEVQARIFKLWLFKKDKLIHVISRLDPFVPNQDFPEEAALRNRSGLKNVFFWGERRCNITNSGQNPNSLLRILLVCRRFFFIGIHCFYGLNTFAFSSLGEFSRFCQGIGPARISRLQHLEITLMGNQYLTVPLDRNGRIPVSRRTSPLSFLLDCHRLKSLVIFVNESEKRYTRRRYENSIIQDIMVRQTAGQPNQRKHRALRCIQGMDFIYALRGLEWIRFYDLYKAITSTSRTATRESVADWSFVEDVTNTSTMQKVPSRRESSRLENLEPLFGNNNHWNPSQADWDLVKGFYINKWSYDQLRQDFPHIPSHMSASSSPRQGHSSNSSSSSSSSSGPHYGGGGPAMSVTGSSITDAIDLGNSESTPGPNTETDLPPRSTTGRAASVMIELSSDSESDSDDDNLFVSQRNHQPQQHQPSPTPHSSEGGPSVTASVPARLHSLTPMGSMTSSLLDRGFSVPANLGRLETPSGLSSRSNSTPRGHGGPQSFASLLNIQPASSAARYLPPNNAAALESASVVALRRGSMSLSMSRSLSRSLSRSVSRSGSLVIERGNGNGNGSRAGSASTYRIRLRYRSSSGSSGSSGSDLFVRQTPRLSERESVDLTNVDEDGEDDGHSGNLLGRSSESGNGELMTIDEDDDENGDQDMEGRDSGYEGADDSDVEMVDSV